MMTSLYIKTHNKTGLKYFGKTIRDPFTYPGSGVHWKRHLNVHGNNVHTVVFAWLDDVTQRALLEKIALDFSAKHDIANSDKWANQIAENGVGSGGPHKDTSCGVDNPRSKLTEDDVRYIRSSSKTYAEMGRELGVTEATICDVRSGRSWKHITDAPPVPPKGVHGENNRDSILTDDDVRYIRRSSETSTVLALEFNVSLSALCNARVGKTWQHIKDVPPVPVSDGRGEGNPFAKLTADDVRYIRRSSETLKVLALKFNVVQTAVAMAKSGESWGHIKDVPPVPISGTVGENNSLAKLTEEKVRYIRASSATGVELGRELGVHPSAIGYARARKTWKHVK